MLEFQYVGTELDLFAEARNWKTYWASHIRPHVAGRVLEVGAGFGGASDFLISGSRVEEWNWLEPDPGLAARCERHVESQDFLVPGEVLCGTLADVARGERYDTILYLDVLEHIEDDAGEVSRAWECLKPNGLLIVLAPAHPWLFTPFDEAIGHFRRYTTTSLVQLMPDRQWKLEDLKYLDSVGMLASAGNRLLLRAAHPTRGQIRFWDRCLVPFSRYLDPFINYRMGKSVLGVWRARKCVSPGAS